MPGFCFRHGDQFVHRLGLEIGIDHQHLDQVKQVDDRRDLLGIERKSLEEVLVVDHRIGIDDADRVAVRLRILAGARADIAGAAGTILDDQRLAEALVHFLAEHAHEDVADAAGARGGEHVDRAGRVVVGEGGRRAARQRRRRSSCDIRSHCFSIRLPSRRYLSSRVAASVTAVVPALVITGRVLRICIRRANPAIQLSRRTRPRRIPGPACAAVPDDELRVYCHPDSFAFTIPLALAISIWPAYLPRSTPMTLPMSFMPAAPVSFTAASIAAVISASDICLGR